MPRKFNTAGHNLPDDHFILDPFARINWREIERFIDDKKYFLLHAPRQTGKTTLLEAMVQRLNREGRYEAMRFSVHSAQAAEEDLAMGMRTIVQQMLRIARYCLPNSWLAAHGPGFVEGKEPATLFADVLTEWAAHSKKPTVLLIDEIDALVGNTLVSVLTQLRDGYIARPVPFVHSVLLCGVRSLHEFRINEPMRELVRGGSPFNVVSDSVRLGCFREDDVRALYGQYTSETGQSFEEATFPRVMELTGGQPWLVNALARELTEKTPELQDRSREITLYDVDEAKEKLIQRRDTHIHQLGVRLQEDRIRRVIVPILNGGELGERASTADQEYAIDLGLVAVKDGVLRIANRIYQEVIPRELAAVLASDVAVQVQRSAFIKPCGRLDLGGMLRAFQKFYRVNSEAWTKRVLYPEAAPHILLQAWLQRVVNHGGQIEREHALGTGRVDILVRHFYVEGGVRKEQEFVIEVKIVLDRQSVETTVLAGLEQTARYADICNSEEAHLVVVDGGRRSWDEKVYERVETVGGREVVVWGM